MLRKLKPFAFAFTFVFAIALHSGKGEKVRIETTYPIVFAHGLLGFDSMFGAIKYWNGIPEALREHGLQVYVTRVSKLNSTQVRGEQLATQIGEILKKSGAKKVNLIGHSHGGLDARYVAARYPNWVASVTTVGSPHQGAVLADLIIGQQGVLTSSASAMLNAFGEVMNALSGDSHEQDAQASLEFLTTKSVKQFNSKYPQGLPTKSCGEGEPVVNGMRFYSWGGIKVRTNLLDFTDYLFSLTALADTRESDGMVERCSTHFGKVIRDDYRHNHLDLVNGMWGFVGSDDINPVEVFIQHAQRLESDGV